MKKSKLEKVYKADVKEKLDQENKSNNPKTVINEEHIFDYVIELIEEKYLKSLREKSF